MKTNDSLRLQNADPTVLNSATDAVRGRRYREPDWALRLVKKFFAYGGLYFFMTLLALIFMIPLLWMLSTSLKGRAEIFAWPPQWIPSDPQWQNYGDAFAKYPLGRFMFNSAFLVVVNILGELISVPIIAYGFARLRFPGKRILFILMLVPMMIPGHIKLIPLFTMYQSLGMIGTYWPLTLPSFFWQSVLYLSSGAVYAHHPQGVG